MSLHTYSLIISIILLYISCGASKPQMKSRCSQCSMLRWYFNLGICVSSRATSWGSARVSCPPDHKAVGTVMSFTLYRGGVDWGGEAGRNLYTSDTGQFYYRLSTLVLRVTEKTRHICSHKYFQNALNRCAKCITQKSFGCKFRGEILESSPLPDYNVPYFQLFHNHMP